MDRELIIRLAREAGLVYFCVDGWTSPTPENKHAEGVDQEALERFAALVAAHEREECARVCEDEGERIDASWMSCAAAIRSMK